MTEQRKVADLMQECINLLPYTDDPAQKVLFSVITGKLKHGIDIIRERESATIEGACLECPHFKFAMREFGCEGKCTINTPKGRRIIGEFASGNPAECKERIIDEMEKRVPPCWCERRGEIK